MPGMPVRPPITCNTGCKGAITLRAGGGHAKPVGETSFAKQTAGLPLGIPARSNRPLPSAALRPAAGEGVVRADFQSCARQKSRL